MWSLSATRLAGMLALTVILVLPFAWIPPGLLGLVSSGVSQSVLWWVLVWMVAAGAVALVSPGAGLLLGWSALTLAARGFPGWGMWSQLALTAALGTGAGLVVALPTASWRRGHTLWIAVVLLQALHATLQIAVHVEWPFPGTAGAVVGSSGWWGATWMFGTYLAMGLPSVALWPGFLPKLAALGLLVLIGLTGARVAWAGAVAGLIVAGWLGLPGGQIRKGLAAVGAVVVLVGGLLLAHPWVSTRDVARLHVWATMGAYLQEPEGLVGYGLGSFAPWFSQLRHSPDRPREWSAFGFNAVDQGRRDRGHISLDTGPEEVWYHAHNEYLQALFEWGVPGVLALALLVWQLLGCVRRGTQGHARRITAGLAGGLTAFGVVAMGAWPAHVEGLALTAVWLAVGLFHVARWEEWSV